MYLLTNGNKQQVVKGTLSELFAIKWANAHLEGEHAVAIQSAIDCLELSWFTYERYVDYVASLGYGTINIHPIQWSTWQVLAASATKARKLTKSH